VVPIRLFPASTKTSNDGLEPVGIHLHCLGVLWWNPVRLGFVLRRKSTKTAESDIVLTLPRME